MAKIKRAKAILRNYHALEARKYVGDLDAICTLIDLEIAVTLAQLTDRQFEALRLVYGEDLTQAGAGKCMGVSQVAVKQFVDDTIARIDEVYEAWAWLDGELSADDFTENYELEAV